MFIGQRRKLEDRVTRCDHSDSSQCASPRNKQILSGLTLEEPYFEKIEPLRLSPTRAKCKNVNISPNAMLVGAGFEFFSCFRAGFVSLLSEEAAENGANFGGSPQCTVHSGIWHVCSAETTTELISGTDAVAALYKSALMMLRFLRRSSYLSIKSKMVIWERSRKQYLVKNDIIHTF